MSLDLSALNEEQLLPVMDTEGAVLVTAGAGSGKTRLLTYRIAHIVRNLGVPAYNILAITFTNKAAKEMKERLGKMLPDADDIFVSTFHAMCVRILRRFINKLGYSPNFSIYDDDEKKRVIKAVAAEISMANNAAGDESADSEALAGSIYLALSRIKNGGQDADWYAQNNKHLPDIDDITEGVRRYENHMKNNDALDFDDLLLVTLRLLMQDEEARQFYQKRFKYIHVDEFQDTNVIQYKLVKILSGGSGNILAVGDEDQSIYGWRGANIENIKDFIREFKGCRVYKLEQNYRSTKNILQLANSVIKNNSARIEKNLWTENEDGIRPQVYIARGDSEEADFVMQTVKGLRDNGHSLSGMAVLMRINALSRSIEQKFMFYGIPYRVYGGFKFYDRKEIKDVTAYLKLLVNHRDNEAAKRVIAFPKKGIGDTSVQKMLTIARDKDLPLYGVIMASIAQNPDAEEIRQQLGKSLSAKLSALAGQLGSLYENRDFKTSVLLKYLYKLLDLDEAFGTDSEESDTRKHNVRELINSVIQTEELNPKLTLDEYVQQIMLLSDLDTESEGDCVNLYTVHSAKGLEFDTVFIIGAEDGLFPLSRAMDNPDELEEERRLMYVALTRSKKRLFISHTRSRFMYGRYTQSIPSRFLYEAGLLKLEKRDESYSPAVTQRPAYVPPIPANLPKSNVDINALSSGTKIKHKRLGCGVIKSVDKAARQVEVEFETVGNLTLSIDFAPITIEQ